jgi:spore coat-associated protein N
MSDSFKLTRRRALGGLATIGATSAAAGAGTMAAFSDTEQSTDNQISAGTLNLKPRTSSDGGSFDISVSGLAPGESAEVGYLDLKNAGSVDGFLDYDVTDISDLENGRNDAETAAGDSSASTGELSKHLKIRAFVDRSPGNGTRNEQIPLTSGYVSLSTGRVQTDVPVAGGERVRIWVDAHIDSGAGNKIQSDVTEVDVSFHLTQNK